MTVRSKRIHFMITHDFEDLVHESLLLSSDLSSAGHNTNQTLASKLGYVPLVLVLPVATEYHTDHFGSAEMWVEV